MKGLPMNRRLAFLALLGLAATYPVAAHHSTTMFDHSKVVSIAGTVKEVHWTNPHVAIFVPVQHDVGGNRIPPK